jgi:hypothetical protein
MLVKTIGVEIPTELQPELERSGLHAQDFVQALIDDAARRASAAEKRMTSDAAVDAMLAFIHKQPQSGLSPEDLVALVHEGRR